MSDSTRRCPGRRPCPYPLPHIPYGPRFNQRIPLVSHRMKNGQRVLRRAMVLFRPLVKNCAGRRADSDGW